MSVSPLVTNEAIEAANKAAFFGGRFHGWSPQMERECLEREARTKALATASALRLVEGAKSPTRGAGRDSALFLAGFQAGSKDCPWPKEVGPSPEWSRDAKAPGTFAVFEHRDWSDEYRVRFETVTPGGASVPDQTGARVTDMLTHRGARKIVESCFYVAKKRGGFSTFLTLTLNEEARDRLARISAEPYGQLEPDSADGEQRSACPLWVVARGSARLGDLIQGKKRFVIVQPDHAREKTRDALICSEHQYQHEGRDHMGPMIPVDGETGRPFSPVRFRHSWSIQKEASRFFEAIGQMYKRGWQYRTPYTRQPIRKDAATNRPYTPLLWEPEINRLPGSRSLYCASEVAIKEYKREGIEAEYTPLKYWKEPLDYQWVAEAPEAVDKETGECLGRPNPHIHVMMRWRVPYRDFRFWAKRIERLWGQGMANLQKIENPEAAGAYMAKAAGYMTKGEGKSDQGEIRGNRYGISARARAPAWECLERSQVGILGCLMAEAGENWLSEYGPLIKARDTLKDKLADDAMKAKLSKADYQSRRKKIGKVLEEHREKIAALPRISKHVAILKGREQYEAFRAWAESQKAADGPEWLPKKGDGEGFRQEKGTGIWFAEFRARQWFRRNGRRLRVTDDDFAAWFALIDGGGVVLDEREVA